MSMTSTSERIYELVHPEELRATNRVEREELSPWPPVQVRGTGSTVNLVRLREAVNWVWSQRKVDPRYREWKQTEWRQCVAGRVCYMAGLNVAALNARGRISPTATRLLGISRRQADELFRGSNSARRVRRVARRIAKEAGGKL